MQINYVASTVYITRLRPAFYNIIYIMRHEGEPPQSERFSLMNEF